MHQRFSYQSLHKCLHGCTSFSSSGSLLMEWHARFCIKMAFNLGSVLRTMVTDTRYKHKQYCYTQKIKNFYKPEDSAAKRGFEDHAVEKLYVEQTTHLYCKQLSRSKCLESGSRYLLIRVIQQVTKRTVNVAKLLCASVWKQSLGTRF